MDKVEIKVCIRPYYHDVVEEISRKPKYDKTNDRHYVTYKGKNHTIQKSGGGYVLWVEDD